MVGLFLLFIRGFVILREPSPAKVVEVYSMCKAELDGSGKPRAIGRKGAQRRIRPLHQVRRSP